MSDGAVDPAVSETGVSESGHDRSTCLFCRVADRDIPADVVLEGEYVLAFRDIDPKAPTHVLVITREHWATVADIDDTDVLAELIATTRRVAELEGLPGYRLVFNSGEAAQQSVHHVHGHVIGGRSLTWPPG